MKKTGKNEKNTKKTRGFLRVFDFSNIGKKSAILVASTLLWGRRAGNHQKGNKSEKKTKKHENPKKKNEKKNEKNMKKTRSFLRVLHFSKMG